MYLNGLLILLLLIVHYIADFFVQTQYQAENKSKSTTQLSIHVFTYTLFFVPCIIYTLFKNHLNNDPMEPIIFFVGLSSIYITHWITDYFTSKVSAQYFKENNIRAGFQVVGFDQLIHYLSLGFIFNYLMSF